MVDTEGWSKAELRELASLNAQADALEGKAKNLNRLADAKDKLATAKAQAAAARR